jgi:hypothetical protein
MARRGGLLCNRLNERTLLSWAQTNESLRTADSSSPVIAVMQPAHALLANHGCRSSKLNAAEFSMQEALSLDSRALHGVVFDRSARPRNEWKRLDCQDPGVNLRPILTANESSSELEIVKPRLYSGDATHQVVAEK